MNNIPEFADIPSALSSRPQWVVWRYEARDTDGKPTKVPYQAARPGRKASSNAPHTWAPVERALSTAAQEAFDGIGYVFSADDPFAGFDLDNMLDDQGKVADWARPWLDTLPTYIEISPSGHGVKGIAIGKLPGAGINAGTVELYDQGRYFTITGRRFDNFPAEPQMVNGALDQLYAFAQSEKERHDAEREERRRRAYAEAALKDEAARVQDAGEGNRNDQLNRSAFALAQFLADGLLTESAIVDALSKAAGVSGLGATEIRSTLRSGVQAGRQEARKIPQSVNQVIRAVDAPPAKIVQPAHGTLKPLSATDLLALDIPAPRQFVPGLIREGLSFFIGQPGVGKTPALIQLAIALATGGLWLGAFRVPKVRVAYIGPEYDAGDVRSIIIASTSGRVPLDNLLTFTVENFTGPESEEEAMMMVDDLVCIHKVEAIIIDLFTGFLPPEKFKQNAYRGDYREFLAYHRAALRYHIMLTGAWHGTKRDANPATMYNGGQGFWGAAGGGRMVMYQDEEEQIRLYAQLRGTRPVTYTVSESHTGGRHTWAVLEGADPEPAFGSDIHRAIYRAVKDHAPAAGLTPKVIYGLVRPDLTTNTSEAYVRKCVSVLTKRGIFTSIGDSYRLSRAGMRGTEGTEGSEGTEGTEGSEGTDDEMTVPSVPSLYPEPYPDDTASESPKAGTVPSVPHDPAILPLIDAGVPKDHDYSEASRGIFERARALKAKRDAEEQGGP